MMYSSFRRAVACLLVCCQIMLSCVIAGLSPAYAQTLDTEPPKVGFDTVEEANRGESQVFTVLATDNQSIDKLEFFYRLDVDAPYKRTNMMRIGETDLYSLTIPAESMPSSVVTIQYYIEATDKAGNRTLQGVAFDPLERSLIDRPTSLANGNGQIEPDSASLRGSLSTTQKVVIGVVGLVVVGALVSAAASGSDDGDSEGNTVPVTIISQPLNASQ